LESLAREGSPLEQPGPLLGLFIGPAVKALSLMHVEGMTGRSLPTVFWIGAFSPCILLFCWNEEVVKISWKLVRTPIGMRIRKHF
jgi:hypothetical protein